MSTHTPPPTEPHSPTPTATHSRISFRSLGRSIRRPVQALSFWTAIILPLVYLPLLTQGLESAAIAIAFVTLLGLNVVALYAGHGYNRS